MCKILLSIHPEYVEKILSGEKIYEFRKVLCKENVDKIVIYSTSPVSKVIGEATVEKILVDKPLALWNKTKKHSGITKDYFKSYFHNKDKAIAYKLTDVKKYTTPLELDDFGLKCAPQSFVYLN